MKTINFKVPFKTLGKEEMEKIDKKILGLVHRFSGVVDSSYPEGTNTVYVFTIEDYQRARILRDLKDFGLEIDEMNALVV